MNHTIELQKTIELMEEIERGFLCEALMQSIPLSATIKKLKHVPAKFTRVYVETDDDSVAQLIKQFKADGPKAAFWHHAIPEHHDKKLLSGALALKANRVVAFNVPNSWVQEDQVIPPKFLAGKPDLVAVLYGSKFLGDSKQVSPAIYQKAKVDFNEFNIELPRATGGENDDPKRFKAEEAKTTRWYVIVKADDKNAAKKPLSFYTNKEKHIEVFGSKRQAEDFIDTKLGDGWIVFDKKYSIGELQRYINAPDTKEQKDIQPKDELPEEPEAEILSDADKKKAEDKIAADAEAEASEQESKGSKSTESNDDIVKKVLSSPESLKSQLLKALLDQRSKK